MSEVRPKPSEDFYRYVNHKWINDPSIVIPPEYPRWGSFVALADASLKNQISLLHELLGKAKLSVDEQKLCTIWSASLGRFADWEAGRGSYGPIIEGLERLDAHFNRGDFDHGLAEYMAMSQETGMTIPFSFGHIANLEDSDSVVLDLSPGGLSLPSRDYYMESNFEEKRAMFMSHLHAVEALVGADRLVDGFAEAVMRFETKMAYISMKKDQSREYAKYYTITDLDKFSSEINTLTSLDDKLGNYSDEDKSASVGADDRLRIGKFMATMCDRLRLRTVLEENYHRNYPSGPADARYRMLVFDGDYFRRIFTLLFDEANRTDLKAYLQYQLVKFASENCTKALNEEVFDLYSRKLSGQKEQKSAEKRSVSLLNSWVGFLLGKIYVDRHFSGEDKARLSSMIGEVVQVMEASITRNDWLTTATKSAAIDKLGMFGTKIGFPDVWRSYDSLIIKSGDSLWKIKQLVNRFEHETELLKKINGPVDRTEWSMTPQTVNAYFHPMRNEIVFPAAIIQPPFYAKSIDRVDFEIDAGDRAVAGDDDLCLAAVNFGGIVAVIAHEITHGFDDQGRRFDGHGNINDWWSEQDADLFQSKCDTMMKQTWSFIEQGPPPKTHNLNAKLTMGENLADLGGISLACQALCKRIDARFAGDATLPKKRLALLRIFFHSWAVIWRIKVTDEYLINQLNTDPHAPGPVRANLVKNIGRFYDAFGVKEGDVMFMGESDRVSMW